MLLKTHFQGSVPLRGPKISTVGALNDVPGNWYSSKGFPTNLAYKKCTVPKAYKNAFWTQKEMDTSFITERAIYLAFSSFGKKRTGVPDSFQPHVLQLFVKNKEALKRREQFKAIITLG